MLCTRGVKMCVCVYAYLSCVSVNLWSLSEHITKNKLLALLNIYISGDIIESSADWSKLRTLTLSHRRIFWSLSSLQVRLPSGCGVNSQWKIHDAFSCNTLALCGIICCWWFDAVWVPDTHSPQCFRCTARTCLSICMICIEVVWVCTPELWGPVPLFFSPPRSLRTSTSQRCDVIH